VIARKDAKRRISRRLSVCSFRDTEVGDSNSRTGAGRSERSGKGGDQTASRQQAARRAGRSADSEWRLSWTLTFGRALPSATDRAPQSAIASTDDERPAVWDRPMDAIVEAHDADLQALDTQSRSSMSGGRPRPLHHLADIGYLFSEGLRDISLSCRGKNV
jgi:hypothetical protein